MSDNTMRGKIQEILEHYDAELAQQFPQSERNIEHIKLERLIAILDQVPWQPCLHDQCPECLGTGVRRFGGTCVHGISCPCPK